MALEQQAESTSCLPLSSFNSLASYLAEAHRALAEEEQYCHSLSKLVSTEEEEEQRHQSSIQDLQVSMMQLKHQCVQLQSTKAGLQSSAVSARHAAEAAVEQLLQQQQKIKQLRKHLQTTLDQHHQKQLQVEAQYSPECRAAADELDDLDKAVQRLEQENALLAYRRRNEAWLRQRSLIVHFAEVTVRYHRLLAEQHQLCKRDRHVLPEHRLTLSAPSTTGANICDAGGASKSAAAEKSEQRPVKSKYFPVKASQAKPKNLRVSFKLHDVEGHTEISEGTDHSGTSIFCSTANVQDMDCSTPACEGSVELTSASDSTDIMEVDLVTPVPAARSAANVSAAKRVAEGSFINSSSRVKSSSTVNAELKHPTLISPPMKGNTSVSSAQSLYSWRDGVVFSSSAPAGGGRCSRSGRPATPYPRSRSLSRLSLPRLQFQFSGFGSSSPELAKSAGCEAAVPGTTGQASDTSGTQKMCPYRRRWSSESSSEQNAVADSSKSTPRPSPPLAASAASASSADTASTQPSSSAAVHTLSTSAAGVSPVTGATTAWAGRKMIISRALAHECPVLEGELVQGATSREESCSILNKSCISVSAEKFVSTSISDWKQRISSSSDHSVMSADKTVTLVALSVGAPLATCTTSSDTPMTSTTSSVPSPTTTVSSSNTGISFSSSTPSIITLSTASKSTATIAVNSATAPCCVSASPSSCADVRCSDGAEQLQRDTDDMLDVTETEVAILEESYLNFLQKSGAEASEETGKVSHSSVATALVLHSTSPKQSRASEKKKTLEDACTVAKVAKNTFSFKRISSELKLAAVAFQNNEQSIRSHAAHCSALPCTSASSTPLLTVSGAVASSAAEPARVNGSSAVFTSVTPSETFMVDSAVPLNTPSSTPRLMAGATPSSVSIAAEVSSGSPQSSLSPISCPSVAATSVVSQLPLPRSPALSYASPQAAILIPLSPLLTPTRPLPVALPKPYTLSKLTPFNMSQFPVPQSPRPLNRARTGVLDTPHEGLYSPRISSPDVPTSYTLESRIPASKTQQVMSPLLPSSVAPATLQSPAGSALSEGDGAANNQNNGNTFSPLFGFGGHDENCAKESSGSDGSFLLPIIGSQSKQLQQPNGTQTFNLFSSPITRDTRSPAGLPTFSLFGDSGSTSGDGASVAAGDTCDDSSSFFCFGGSGGEVPESGGSSSFFSIFGSNTDNEEAMVDDSPFRLF